jgi:hypothetical protein
MIELKYTPDNDKSNPHRELKDVIRGITAIIESMSLYSRNTTDDYTSAQVWPLLKILIKPILFHFLEDEFIECPVPADDDVFIEEPLDIEIEPFIP